MQQSDTQQSGEVLLREQDGDILIATMNRPERMNALDDNLSTALNEAWLDFRDSPDLKVMIITGAGDRAFCSGVDLRRNDERARDLGAQTAQAILDADRSRGVRLSFNGNNFGLWKPVIAAINGWCLAAGCEMALACDLRIMEEHAQMGLPEVKRGMGAKQTTHKLYHLTNLNIGLEMAWTGDTLTAQRAYDLGLVTEVAPKSESVIRAKGTSPADLPFPFGLPGVPQAAGLPEPGPSPGLRHVHRPTFPARGERRLPTGPGTKFEPGDSGRPRPAPGLKPRSITRGAECHLC